MSLKKLSAMVLMASMVMTVLLIALPVNNVSAVLPDSITVEGVLDTDYYSLYPFEKGKLTIGISKYGELIDPQTKVGLQYESGGILIDPFASDPYVPEFEWNQGWLINITYTYAGAFRYVWAYALYSDVYADPDSIGGPWQRADSPTDITVLGGRKYGGWAYNPSTGGWDPIGYASTEPLKVIYNGPRRFIAVAETVIGEDPNTPLVKLKFTFIFNKVRKYVIIYKDVIRLDTRKFSGNFQIEFSNRGEWDLGLVDSPASYVHWFNNKPTSYSVGWHPFYDSNHPAKVDLVQVISTQPEGFVGFAMFWPSLISKYVEATELTPRSMMLTSMETTFEEFTYDGSPIVTTYDPVSYPRGNPDFDPWDPTTYPAEWDDTPWVFVDGQLKTPGVDFSWNSITNEITFLPGSEPAIGSTIWVVYKKPVHKTDMSVEPATPYVIGEWDFELPKHGPTQFRGVTVYGVVNNHNARDSPPRVDVEVEYIYNEIFKPWGLDDVVWKGSRRWVQFHTITTADYLYGAWITLEQKPVLRVNWESYSNVAEKVEANGQLLYPMRNLLGMPGDYQLIVYSDGTGVIWIPPGTLPAGTVVKILYSTGTWLSGGWASTRQVSGSYVVPPNSDLTQYVISVYDTDSSVDNLGADHSFELGYNVRLVNLSTTSFTTNETIRMTNSITHDYNEFKVFKEDTASLEVIDLQNPVNHTLATDQLEVTLEYANLMYYLTPPDRVDLHVYYLSVQLYYEFEFNITVYPNGTVSIDWLLTTIVDSTFLEKVPGSHEWTVVGRDAASVDSVGASLVTAAFKNKQVEIVMAGLDMFDPELANRIPFIMANFSPVVDLSWSPFVDSIGRAALRDDWCTTYPVSSANIIGLGGPLANLLSYYSNDFTSAYFDYATGEIVALSSWTMNRYTSDSSTGYAVITTFIDPNGTEIFLIWGLWGRDTYYASKWFHDEGIFLFQDAPSHLTSIVVEIDYTAHNPVVTPVEFLGTVSEWFYLAWWPWGTFFSI